MALCALVLGGMAPALLVIRNETQVDRLRAQAETQYRYAQAEAPPPVDGAFHTSRAELLAASIFLSDAAHDRPDGGRRVALLADAEDRLSGIALTRPYWADVHLLRSSAARQRDGDFSAVALDALTASYDDAAFLRHGADWRIRYGFAAWPALSGRTRRQVIAEAVWLAHILPTRRQEIFDLARQSDAYVSLGQAWRDRIITGR